MTRRLLILDWDGTLARPEHSETFRAPGEKYVWMSDDMPDLLTFLHNEQGYEIAVATNQGGIALGIIRRDETEEAIFALLKALDFPVPFLLSPYHEKRPERYHAFKTWRKPAPGMLLQLRWMYPDIAPDAVLVVGDREEDRDAAKAIGYPYQAADEFFTEARSDLSHFESAEINAGEVFEEQEGTSADRGEDGPPF